MYITQKLTWLNNSKRLKILLIIGGLWLVLSAWLWWVMVYSTPERVFEGMLRKNFSTANYTRTITQTGATNVTRESQVQLLESPSIRTLETMEQSTNKQVSEYRLFPDKGFVKLLEYPGVDPPDDWALLPDSHAYIREVAEYTYFPLARVTPDTRELLIDFISKHTVYHPQYQTVKSETLDGRTVYTYRVSVQLQAYAGFLKELAGNMGFKEYAETVDPSQYADTKPVVLDVQVDKYSRRLVQTKTTQEPISTERFSAYGATSSPLEVPKEHVSVEELMKQIGG